MPTEAVDEGHSSAHTLSERSDGMTYRPRLLDARAQSAELATLAESPGLRVHDEIELQLRDLVRARTPELDLSSDDVDARVASLLGSSTPREHGSWVHYPWSGRLVHVLPREQFRELRADRNRPKITSDESDRLSRLAVGIVGLSVGNAVALTLALEGAVGHLRLADFDHLDLSNLNRVRAGVHDIGMHKAVLAARQVMETDPYASLSVFLDGVNAENVERFLDGDENLGPALDIVIDECDSLDVKLLVREHARRRRLPVLMETSDRGMLDVERFDLEPDRPLLHGLVGDAMAADLPDAAALDAAPEISLRMVGADTMSARLAAALVEVGSTISTWPQLASDVALGGATVASAVRMIGLGEDLPSGRRYVDLLRTIRDVALDPPRPDGGQRPPTLPRHDASRRRPADGIPGPALEVIEHAILAPSGGNAQPWHFWVDDGRIWITHDLARSDTHFAASGRASHLAIGAAIENAAIAAAAQSLPTDVQLFPDPHDPAVVAALDFGQADHEVTAARGALAPLVRRRQTDRRMALQEPLDDTTCQALVATAAEHGAHLKVSTDTEQIAEVAAIVGEGTRIRTLNAALHRELVGELRYTAEDALRTLDGITVSSLGLPPIGVAAMEILSRPDVVRTLRHLDGGQRIAQVGAMPVFLSSAVGLLFAPEDTPTGWVQVGRALERIWLEATAANLSFQPLAALLFQIEVLSGPDADIYDAGETEMLRELERRLDAVFPRAGPPAMLFRVGRVEGEAERSLRLPAEWVTSLGPPTPGKTAEAGALATTGEQRT